MWCDVDVDVDVDVDIDVDVDTHCDYNCDYDGDQDNDSDTVCDINKRTTYHVHQSLFHIYWVATDYNNINTIRNNIIYFILKIMFIKVSYINYWIGH